MWTEQEEELIKKKKGPVTSKSTPRHQLCRYKVFWSWLQSVWQGSLSAKSSAPWERDLFLGDRVLLYLAPGLLPA